MNRWIPCLFMAIGVLWSACDSDDVIDIAVPSHFATIEYPEDNIPSVARLALGERLFFETALSLDSTLSCASCHKHQYALADNIPVSTGIDGRLGKRNTPSLYNGAYLNLVNKDGGVKHLDLQAMVPIEDENEMGISILKAADRLRSDEMYEQLSAEAYGRSPDAYVITRALGTYIRSLISADSPYDQFSLGDTTALTTDAKAGMVLFYSDRLKCGNCHSGILFTDHSFRNNGTYLNYNDLGRALITQEDGDIGRFRVPSLRNVNHTAPYMHDGSMASLSAVIEHYAVGGRGAANQSSLVSGFEITDQEERQLITFLESLSGERALAPLQ